MAIDPERHSSPVVRSSGRRWPDSARWPRRWHALWASPPPTRASSSSTTKTASSMRSAIRMDRTPVAASGCTATATITAAFTARAPASSGCAATPRMAGAGTSRGAKRRSASSPQTPGRIRPRAPGRPLPGQAQAALVLPGRHELGKARLSVKASDPLYLCTRAATTSASVTMTRRCARTGPTLTDSERR